jgi:hypothetical protein
MLTVSLGGWHAHCGYRLTAHADSSHAHHMHTLQNVPRRDTGTPCARKGEREGEGERKRGCSAHGTIRVHLRHTVLSGFAPYLPIRVCCYLRAEEHPLQYAEGAYGHLVHHELRVGRKGKGSP